MGERYNWKQVYIGSGTHLDRVVEMYWELGYEVKLEPISAKEVGECGECYSPKEIPYKLYVKEKDLSP